MSCQDFTATNPTCRSVQLIEPDNTLLTAVSFGGLDQSLDESGSTPVPVGPIARLFVTFATKKASSNYRFEYLYIDTLGINNPGAIQIVPVDTNVEGFLVDLAGLPLAEGYVLRWRVIVVGQVPIGEGVTTPENLRLRLPQARIFTATFVFPRTTVDYGFTELRVENLITAPDSQRVINAQVVEKTTIDFTVGLNPLPDNDDYFLVARTP